MTDVNDNAPVFVLGLQQVTLSENVPNYRLVTTYVAEDADSGDNAAIGYSISAADTALPVTIDSASGQMFLIMPLDYEDESRRSFQFNVTASNPDGLATSIPVSLIVTDTNDNVPQFSQLPYRTSVIEHSTTGTVVTTVVATDKDQMGNDPITYSITDGNANDAFAVGQSSGVITVNGDINREAIDEFVLKIQAMDSGLATNMTQVIITVEDINDNSPVFVTSMFTFRISEDFSVNSVISTLSATDADQSNTPNSDIMFSILHYTSIFQIGSEDGVLTLVSPLDFETQSFYNITAVATDRGSPQHSDTAIILIYVLNVNENPPVISGNQAIDIFENEMTGYRVAEITATDQDQESITFSLTAHNNSDGLFSINADSGIITLQQPLDFETQVQHILNVTASDGLLNSTAMITVNVLDINEFAPVFSNSTSTVLRVIEQQSINTCIGQVSASDNDTADVITYSIQLSHLFTINSSTGEICTATVLDRELLVMSDQFLPPISQEILRVLATDSGQVPGVHTTTAEIIIEIVDVNDNIPLFTDDFYSVSVPEDDDAVASIITVTAIDLDLGNNGLVSYYLTNEDSLPFSINSVTGDITGQLDRESMDMFTLQVTARDNGNPVRSTNTTINVTVLDVNDNFPIFDKYQYETNVSESRSDVIFETPILSLSASDKDIGENSRISYSIAGEGICSSTTFFNTPECFFSIDSDTGIFYSIIALNYETLPVPQYEITVVARDNGMPLSLSATALVTINVLNVDEAPPRFSSSCDAAVSEDVPVWSMVTSCPAFDFDTGASEIQTIAYSIPFDSTGVFSINSTGDIILEKSLDYETVTQYRITIQASDAAGLISLRRVRLVIGYFLL